MTDYVIFMTHYSLLFKSAGGATNYNTIDTKGAPFLFLFVDQKYVGKIG